MLFIEQMFSNDIFVGTNFVS